MLLPKTYYHINACAEDGINKPEPFSNYGICSSLRGQLILRSKILIFKKTCMYVFQKVRTMIEFAFDFRKKNGEKRGHCLFHYGFRKCLDKDRFFIDTMMMWLATTFYGEKWQQLFFDVARRRRTELFGKWFEFL